MTTGRINQVTALSEAEPMRRPRPKPRAARRTSRPAAVRPPELFGMWSSGPSAHGPKRAGAHRKARFPRGPS